MDTARLYGTLVLTRAVRRWSRFLQRLRARAQWHIGGVLLWLLQRPSLRYVPLPFPSVSTVAAWKLQAENMVQRGTLARRHHERALPSLTASRLVEASWLRDRLGLRLSFLEDPLVDGMLAAGASTGRGKSLKAAVLRKLGRDEAVKSFLGPKGGLPTLKAKLATLLHVEAEAKDTVDSLKKKIRTPDAGDDNDDYRYTGYGILSTYATALRPKKPKDPARPVPWWIRVLYRKLCWHSRPSFSSRCSS